MRKKLTSEKINELLETGIDAFAQRGLDRANINAIARDSGVSVGVIYKYFTDKDGFFLACLRHALEVLKGEIDAALSAEGSLMTRVEHLLRAIGRCAREHPSYNVMYNEITAGASSAYARQLAGEIEGISARAYTAVIEEAKARGEIHSDVDAPMLAFFFDNLLLLLQFSYSCDYYRSRFGEYCGAAAADDEYVVRQLMTFIQSAFGR
ncbi:MAG: TetR family transcriptional regulator [Clostridiales bacterium]|nr:TetR family transcriptional regulator [Clostridiales bacterium]